MQHPNNRGRYRWANHVHQLARSAQVGLVANVVNPGLIISNGNGEIKDSFLQLISFHPMTLTFAAHLQVRDMPNIFQATAFRCRDQSLVGEGYVISTPQTTYLIKATLHGGEHGSKISLLDGDSPFLLTFTQPTDVFFSVTFVTNTVTRAESPKLITVIDQ